MTALEASLLGAVQGLFMFVPVSSTSHLVLLQHAFIALGLTPLVIGFVVAAGVGIVSLWLVVQLLLRARFRFFASYVWALAALVLVLSFWGVGVPTDVSAAAHPVASLPTSAPS